MTQLKSPVQAGISVVGSCLADLGENKLSMSQQSTAAATKANWILGCTHWGISDRDRDVILPLHSVLVRAHMEGGLCPVLVPTF